MSILVAVKTRDWDTILACDSMSNNWVTKERVDHKFLAFDNFYLWFAWDMNAHMVARYFVYKKINKIRDLNPTTLVEIMKLVEDGLESTLSMKRWEHPDRDHMDTDMIAVDLNWNIYTCNAYMNITKHENYWGIWSWITAMLPVLHYINKNHAFTMDTLCSALDSLYEIALHCWFETKLIIIPNKDKPCLKQKTVESESTILHDLEEISKNESLDTI